MMKKPPSNLRRLLRLTSPYKKQLIFAMITAVLYVILNLLVPVLTGQAIDRMVDAGQVDLDGVIFIIALIFMSALMSAVFQWLMGMFVNSVGYFTVRDMRRAVFRKFNSTPLRFIDSHPHGDLISRMINDADACGDGLIQGITQLFSGIVMILCTLGFMLFTNALIALVVVIITPLSMFVAAFITTISQKMFRRQSTTQGEISSFIEEYVGNQKTVRAFAFESRAEQDFEIINEELRVCGQKSQFYSSLANPSTRFVNGLVTAAVCITGAVSAINGSMTIGQISAFITYANQYTKPFNEVTGVVPQIQSALAGAGRIFSLLDESDQTPDSDRAISMNSCKGIIDIENISFSYNKGKDLIKNFNLHVSPGQNIAIVGPTGCGKTTLINLLMRFYDVDSGDIKIDGESIYNIKRSSLRGLYGMVLQDSWLYNATIRENIAYGRPDATMDEIKQAAAKAYIDTFIERLPDGYNTVITEQGANLSKGQRQLLCIARVMLAHPPMLILDEATSSIDTRTEMNIQRAFDSMMKDRTSFIVAHRLSTIKNADIILVMKDGNVIEQGSHDELMDKGGFYCSLYNSQFAPTKKAGV